MSQPKSATPEETLADTLKRNPKKVLVVFIDDAGRAMVSWSAMPLTEVCFLHRAADLAIGKALDAPAPEAGG